MTRTRREVLRLAGSAMGSAAMWPFDTPAQTARPSAAPATGLEPIPLADVRLLDGPFLDAQRRDLAYLTHLEPDRLLHAFRVNAGLKPKAPIYGGWESEEPWVGIRCHGHTLGHYLSGAALMHAATGEPLMKQRVDYIVGELEACQAAARSGLVCAFPDGPAQLENAIAGRKVVGVPWYTLHKIFAGLRDAHVLTGNAAALDVLTRLADWTQTSTRALTNAQLQRMLDVEHGGMNEVLADIGALTGNADFIALARRFCHEALLAPLSEGRDTLDGLHANTQIPKVVGFERLFQLTGDARYERAAGFFWQTVVERRSYVTGGHGDREHFFPPSEFASRLSSAKTMETCGIYNMLRLTKLLMRRGPSTPYADFHERALFNAILASQDPDSGMMTYFQATRPGYVRLFHTPERSFWCCTGSGMESHAKHGDAIYFERGDALWINLFIASAVAWRAKGVTIRQTTRFPDEPRTRLTIAVDRPTRTTITVRRPGWCATTMSIRINGRPWPDTGVDAGHVEMTRDWRNGDVVDIELPMTVRVETLPGASDLVAFLHGPIALAGRLGAEGVTPADQIIVNERESGNMLNAPVDVPRLTGDVGTLASRLKPVPNLPQTFRTSGVGRPTDVELAPFSRLAHERYNLYWKVERATGV